MAVPMSPPFIRLVKVNLNSSQGIPFSKLLAGMAAGFTVTLPLWLVKPSVVRRTSTLLTVRPPAGQGPQPAPMMVKLPQAHFCAQAQPASQVYSAS